MDEREVEVHSLQGKIILPAKTLGDWGVIPVKGYFFIVHLPTGNCFNYGFNEESAALGAVQEITKLRNSWDITVKGVSRELEIIHEIVVRHGGKMLYKHGVQSEDYDLNGYDGKPMEV